MTMDDTQQIPPLTAIAPETPVQQLSAQDEIDIEYFKKIDLRVGIIEQAEAVPKSKKLLKLQVNLGEKYGTRQILSGISTYFAPEQLIGKRIVVVANLKKASLMGHESQGMLLAASDEGGSRLILLDPGQDMDLGAQVR